MTDVMCCLGCGYSLRHLPTNRCPECGRDFDPGDSSTYVSGESVNSPLVRYFRSTTWHGTAARWSMLVFLVVQGVVYLDRVSCLPIWLLTYLIIALPALRRRYIQMWLIWRYKLQRRMHRVDRANRNRARRWLYVALILTLFRVPQWATFGVEYPFLRHEMMRLYWHVGMFGNYKKVYWLGPTRVEVGSFSPRRIVMYLGFEELPIAETYDLYGSKAIGPRIHVSKIWDNDSGYDLDSWLNR